MGIILAGALREGPSTAVGDPLTVTAVVLRSQSHRVVIIGCDAIRLSVETSRRLRARAADIAGVALSDVLLNVSHTHAVPDTVAATDANLAGEPEGEELLKAVENYWERFEVALLEAVRTAASSERPAVYDVRRGRTPVGVNRREVSPSGELILGENPEGVVDDRVTVLRIDTIDHQPLASLMHYSCHPDVLGPKSGTISADYVGVARRVIESLTGTICLFLQGAAGDIDPICGIVTPPDGYREMERLGQLLGCEATRLYLDMDLGRSRHQRVVWKSAASTVTGWMYGDSQSEPEPEMAMDSTTIRLPLTSLPSHADAQTEYEAAARERAAIATASLSDRMVSNRRLSWLQLQLDATQSKPSPEMDVEIQVLRIGDLVLVALPGEPFVEIGLEIESRSPASVTLTCGYSNGVIFYIPTAAAFQQGGYEVLSYKNYQQPTGPTRDWAPQLVDASLTLITRLTSQ